MNPHAVIHLIVAAVVIALAIPLILKKVKPNCWYGVRIPEAFKSEERWYEINRFGGGLLLAWGVIVAGTGVAGLTLEKKQWPDYTLTATWIIMGGLALLVAAIMVYAARTRKD
ncbi:MAG: SdpI family protein [Opitutaceae bacterium]|nr:SdpI family protein [Opitutaceae bacterium]